MALERFINQVTEPLLLPDEATDGPGFKPEANIMGEVSGHGEESTLATMSEVVDTYDYTKRYSESEKRAHDQFNQVRTFLSIGGSLHANDLRAGQIRALNDPEADTALFEFSKAFDNGLITKWYNCGVGSRYGSCPAEYVKGDINAIYFLKTLPEYGNGDAIRVTVDLNKGLGTTFVLNQMRAEYPQANCKKAFQYSNNGRNVDTWVVCATPNETFLSDGQRFIIQISPEAFERAFKSKAMARKQSIVERYKEMQTLAKSKVAAADRESRASMFD